MRNNQEWCVENLTARLVNERRNLSTGSAVAELEKIWFACEAKFFFLGVREANTAVYLVTKEQHVTVARLLQAITEELHREGGSLLDPDVVTRQLTAVLADAPSAFAEKPVPLSKSITLGQKARFNPEEFLGKGWTFTRRAPSVPLPVLDLSRVQLYCAANSLEPAVAGVEFLLRLMRASKASLGADAFFHFWEHQDDIPAAWRDERQGKPAVIGFFGSLLRSPSGNHCVMCLSFELGAWSWRHVWLTSPWDVTGLAAVLAPPCQE